VVTVQRTQAEAGALARLAGDFLAGHGTPHRLHAIATDAPVPEVLLEEVRRQSPRLLVMGAHRHHAWRDLFVTSVTRRVLGACPVPVFVGV
jgi:nucleotide-binding universal stress UspA family protein